MKIFGLPLTYAYAMLRQSVAGNSTFRVIVFCNLGTPKGVDYMQSGSNRVIRFCGWWLELFGTK